MAMLGKAVEENMVVYQRVYIEIRMAMLGKAVEENMVVYQRVYTVQR